MSGILQEIIRNGSRKEESSSFSENERYTNKKSHPFNAFQSQTSNNLSDFHLADQA